MREREFVAGRGGAATRSNSDVWRCDQPISGREYDMLAGKAAAGEPGIGPKPAQEQIGSAG